MYTDLLSKIYEQNDSRHRDRLKRRTKGLRNKLKKSNKLPIPFPVLRLLTVLKKTVLALFSRKIGRE